jgi:adenylate cyclase
VLVYAGQHAEALNAMQTAFRLEPRPSPELYGYMGWVLFWNRRYEEALGALEKALEGGVEYFNTLAMTYAELGRLEEARAMVAEIHERDPRANLSYYRALYASRHKRAVDLEQLIDALRKAGIPEWPMGYEARVEDRLDAATIETLVFGRTWVGHLSTSGRPFVQEFDKDGKVGFRDADSLLAGSAWVENGMLCVDFPARGVVRKSCGYLYRNPKGAPKGQNEYTHVGIESILTFSIRP